MYFKRHTYMHVLREIGGFQNITRQNMIRENLVLYSYEAGPDKFLHDL